LAEAFYIQELIKAKYQFKLKEPISCDVWMIVIFEFKESDLMTKKGIRKKTSPNLSNLYQLPEDCMQTPKISSGGRRSHNGASIIVDDDQIRSHDLSRIVSGDETRLHIYLLRYDGGEKVSEIIR
jgi:Holliday junction resolvase RusA-like endonuclease